MREPGALPATAPPGMFRATPGLAGHPARVTLERLADHIVPFEMRLGPADDPGWFQGEDLSEPGSALEFALLDRRATYFGADPTFAGLSLVLDAVATAAAPLVAVVTERRALDLSPPHLALRLGERPGVAIRDPHLTVVSGDPASDEADVRTVPDAGALFDHVVETFFHRFVARLVDAVASFTHGSRRTLWSMATSSTAATLSLAASVIADPRAVSEEIETLFERAGGVAAATAPSFEEVSCWRHRELTHVRRTCCLFHKLPGADYCSTCPFRSTEARTAVARRAIAARLGVPAS